MRRAVRASLGVLGAAALGVLTLLILDRLFPPPLDIEVGTLVTDRDGRPLRAFPVANGRWRLRADADRIDPLFIRELVAVEDKRFHEHHGVDGLAAARAVRGAALTGKVRSGASTLTMQTARLLEPRPRTLPSKLIECLRAWQIERRLSKDEILALYLTLTPYGGNIEGIEAASWAWLGRGPSELTDAERALLIALPQAPEARRPDRRPGAARAARAGILRELAERGLLGHERAKVAAAAALPARRPFPSDAWHAAATVRARGHVVSTLDARLQAEAERLARALAEKGGAGVQASILLVDVPTRGVLASVGSAGRDRAGGWLDLTDRRRSPGSTLKPFVYALAFGDGVAAPGTLVRDLPTRIGGYAPENFDRAFRGEVTVADALRHSLNVPAVRMLDQVSPDRFVAALDDAGAAPRAPIAADGSGLAVALGGLGLTARDLAVLYAGLADDGVTKPLAWTPDAVAENASSDGHRFLSPEAARDVLGILASAPAPPGRMPARLSASAPRVAYKTGTSYGYRDAWAAGVADGLVAIVWTGRPDGAPRPGVTGRDAVLPTLFALLDAAAGRGTPGAPLPDAPRALARLDRTEGPRLLFPPDGAEVWADGDGMVLAASGSGRLRYHVDGAPLTPDAGGGVVWTPQSRGFYKVTVTDDQGREATARVRVRR